MGQSKARFAPFEGAGKAEVLTPRLGLALDRAGVSV
jgi:hypothetical protein